MKEKILITSALLYANGTVHFGHIAGAYLPADCYARFERMQGKDVLYISGSDEYGVAITLSAEMAKRTPKEHVDYFHDLNKQLFSKLNISFDHYSRTTWDGHVEVTHQFFLDLFHNGYIEERVTNQLFSETDQKFLADRYVVGTCPHCHYENARGDECGRCGANFEATDLINPRSKLTNSPLTYKPTKHWFIRYDLFKDRLIEFLQSRNWKSNVVNFTKNYIDDLKPRGITRDLEWGISVPLNDAQGKVIYVWFDAPIGYISATIEWAQLTGQPDMWKDYWLDPQTKLVQFIGKDNIPFHAIFFPAMIMGQNQPYKLVDELIANEFYNLEGRQFSKSEGWTIDIEEFLKHYDVDQIRYVLAANAPETADSEFTWLDFANRCNGELLGKLGNLVNRVLVFAQNHCIGRIPAIAALEQEDHDFFHSLRTIVDEIKNCYSTCKLRRASQLVMELAQIGNVYFDSKKPWKDAKDLATRGKMETTIACCLECIKFLALCCYPIIPATADKIWNMLGFDLELSNFNWNEVIDTPLTPGVLLPQPSILFKRIEEDQIKQEMAKLPRTIQQKIAPELPKEKKVETAKAQISINDFRKLDLRVGLVVKAEKVVKSQKLLQLEIDLGTEKRTIISGISQHYSPEDVIGKKVVVVANLEPAKVMGIESHGMILASHMLQGLEVVSLENSQPGDQIS